MPPGTAVGALGVSLGVVAEAAGGGVIQGVGEDGEGGVAADGVEEEGDGSALAFGGGLGQVFDDGLEDGQVADEERAGGAGGCGVLGRGGLGEERLKVLGVEVLGIEAVAEGVGVARLATAARGRIRFVWNEWGTNRGRIGRGRNPPGLLLERLVGVADGQSPVKEYQGGLGPLA